MLCSPSAFPSSTPFNTPLSHPAHRTSYPLPSILRNPFNGLTPSAAFPGASVGVGRTPVNTPRSPAAWAIANEVRDYFSAANGSKYEGTTRTPVATPAVGLGASINSPRRGMKLEVCGGIHGFDPSALAASLATVSTTAGTNAVSSKAAPASTGGYQSFTAAGACLAPPSPTRATASSAPSNSLSARRKPSLRISDLPPLVLHTPTPTYPSFPSSVSYQLDAALSLENLKRLGMSEAEMQRAVSAASSCACTEASEAETVVAMVAGQVMFVDGKRVPTPYPERKAWLEDGDAEQYC
ncbi:hypothetical protein JCM6882_005624 [Rhodosporidiobolus microsporus]